MILRRTLGAALTLALLAAAPAAPAAEDFFIQDGDCVLIWGNSITDDGIYPRLIENYVLTRYPQWKVEFFNLGWGGDRAANVERLRRDLQLCRPTKVTVMLGMNDAGYQPFNPALLRVYLDSLEAELAILKAHGDPQVLLIAPTPWEAEAQPELGLGRLEKPEGYQMFFYPEALRRFSHELGKLAGRRGHRFCDLNYASTLAIREMGGYDGSFRFTAETVHPNVDGQLQMGLTVLQSMGLDPLVAECELDAIGARVVRAERCTVSELKRAAGGLEFTRADQRLPLPVYPSTRQLMKQVLDYPDAWDRDLVRVTGLDPGWYELRIDQQPIDVLTHEQLAAGVNLSRYAHTPQMLQALQVFEQTEIRQDAFWNKWRRVLLAGVGSPRDFTPFKTGALTDSLDRVERAAFAAQHRLNQPRPHRYALRPVAAPSGGERRQFTPVAEFLEDRVKVLVTVDSRTLPEFEPPLTLRGNFSYAPQYGWAIIESKSYYADIPVRLYDDGSHGDQAAGDGVWSVELAFRKDCGNLWFYLRDGRYLSGYSNFMHAEYFNNPWCRQVSEAWSTLAGMKDAQGQTIGLPLDRDRVLSWDQRSLQAALERGLIYQAAVKPEQ